MPKAKEKIQVVFKCASEPGEYTHQLDINKTKGYKDLKAASLQTAELVVTVKITNTSGRIYGSVGSGLSNFKIASSGEGPVIHYNTRYTTYNNYGNSIHLFKYGEYKKSELKFTKHSLDIKHAKNFATLTIVFRVRPFVRVKHIKLQDFRDATKIYRIGLATASLRHKGNIANPKSDINLTIKCHVYMYRISSCNTLVKNGLYDVDKGTIGGYPISQMINKDKFLQWVETIG